MEIRRSVMGRPNLSVRGTVISRWSLVVSRWSLARIIYGSGRRLSTNDWFWKRDAGGNIPAGASFPMRSSRSAGGASVSARTLGLIPFATFAFPWRTLRSKAFNREERENHAKGARKNILAAMAWVCPKAGAVGNSLLIIELGGRKKVSRFWSPEGLFNCRFGEWRHDLVSSGVGMQAVFGELAFEQAFVINHGAEVVEIEAVRMRGDIAFQPAIQFKDFLRRSLGKKILRQRSVVVYGQHRGKHNADVVGAAKVGHGCVVRFDVFEPHWARVSGDVVGAGENDHHFRMKLDHVLPEANEHLRRRLASDAPVDVRLAGKIFVEMPDVGDGVAEEDYAVLVGSGGLEGGVGLAVAGEFTEIIEQRGRLRLAPLLKRLVRGESGTRLLGEHTEREKKNSDELTIYVRFQRHPIFFLDIPLLACGGNCPALARCTAGNRRRLTPSRYCPLPYAQT